MNELAPPDNVALPGWLWQQLPDLSNAALRVVLVVLAETTGWEADSVILSRADFASLSGLAPSSVQNGIEEALNLQLLQRGSVGTSYAYRLKAPEDQSAFPTTPSRNVTALRQLQRLQQRLVHQLEFDRTVLERGPSRSVKAADCPSARGDDRRTVGSTEQKTTTPDQNATLGSKIDRDGSTVTDQLPVTVNDLDQKMVNDADRNLVEADLHTVKPPEPKQSDSCPVGSPRVDPQSVNHLVNHCVQGASSLSRALVHAGAQRKNINNLLSGKHTDTVWGNCDNSACARARGATHLSMFSYSEVLAYAESLKGIRNPGGLAVVYWRSGEMDGEIANFQLRQAEYAEQRAAEEAQRDAEMRVVAGEMLARGEPLAEWEREFIAAFADEFKEEHHVQIQRLETQHDSVV